MSENDLTKEQNIISLMKSSKNENEWNDNADKVLLANGDQYPSFRLDSLQKQ